MDDAVLREVLDKWRRRARRKFRDAELAVDDIPMPADRALKMAAMCETNHILELERLLGGGRSDKG